MPVWGYWYFSIVSYPVLILDSWPVYRFHRRQVRESGIPTSLRIFRFVLIHTVNGFSIVNKAEVGIFLELSCFIYDPTDVVNLVSGSSAFSKSNLNIWNFLVHLNLLKPLLKNFEHCAFIMYFNATYTLNLIIILHVYIYVCMPECVCVLYLIYFWMCVFLSAIIFLMTKELPTKFFLLFCLLEFSKFYIPILFF